MNRVATALGLTLALGAGARAASASTVGLSPLLPNHPAIVADRATCRTPNVPAAIARPGLLIFPSIAAQLGLTGTTKVKVDVDASGELRAAAVFETSGIPSFDAAALEAARDTRYSAEVSDCDHVGGSYIFEVEFAQ